MLIVDEVHALDRARTHHPEVISRISNLEQIQISLEEAADWLPAHADHLREAAADIRTAIGSLRSVDDSLGRVIENERVRRETIRV